MVAFIILRFLIVLITQYLEHKVMFTASPLCPTWIFFFVLLYIYLLASFSHASHNLLLLYRSALPGINACLFTPVALFPLHLLCQGFSTFSGQCRQILRFYLHEALVTGGDVLYLVPVLVLQWKSGFLIT